MSVAIAVDPTTLVVDALPVTLVFDMFIFCVACSLVYFGVHFVCASSSRHPHKSGVGSVGIGVMDPDGGEAQGPASHVERLQWYEHTVKTLFGDGANPYESYDIQSRRENMIENLSKARFMGHYSGYESMGLALGCLVKTMRKAGWPVDMPKHLHACDKDSTCRLVLGAYETPEVAAHIFHDMLDRLPQFLRQKVDSLTPTKRMKSAQAQAQVSEIRELISTYYSSETFDENIKADCSRHKGKCPVYANLLHRPPDTMLISFAGHICKYWSMMGDRLGPIGSSAVPLILWTAEVRLIQPDIIFTECTPLFEARKMFHELLDLYELHIIDLAPECFGDVVKRDRKFCIMTLKTTIRVTAPLTREALLQLLGRQRHEQLKASSIFSAPDEYLLSYMSELAKRRHVSKKTNGATIAENINILARRVLTGAQEGRLRNYLGIGRQKKNGEQRWEDGDEVFFDLEHNCDAKGSPRMSINSVMCLLTHGVLWLEPLKRQAVGLEHMQLQCVPVFIDDGDSVTIPCPFHALFKKGCTITINDLAWKSVGGNAQHLPCVGNILGYCLAHAFKVKAVDATKKKMQFLKMGSSAWFAMDEGANGGSSASGLVDATATDAKKASGDNMDNEVDNAQPSKRSRLELASHA